MTGTRKLARLHQHVHEADGLLVLVGDHRQLAEIDAGGLFEHLATTTNVVQLRTNRRQQHPWERSALTELRNGDVDKALTAFDQNERIHHAPSADAIRELLTQHWFQLRDEGHQPLVLASTRSDVADLNQRIHQRLVDIGQLEPEIAALPDGTLVSIGDLVMCTKNNRHIGLINGDRGTLTHADVEGMTFTNERTGAPSRMPTAMVNQGHLALAYATTVHKAQGQTAEHTLVIGSELADRRGGYVALSRGRQANHLYVVDSLDLPTALSRKRSQELAIEQGA
jgi:ATP-dependent exoDNAse (exonuclease V) alpha subunit